MRSLHYEEVALWVRMEPANRQAGAGLPPLKRLRAGADDADRADRRGSEGWAGYAVLRLLRNDLLLIRAVFDP
jgi:hypothetical protein